MTTKAELDQQDEEYADGRGINPTRKPPRRSIDDGEFEDSAIEAGLGDGESLNETMTSQPLKKKNGQ